MAAWWDRLSSLNQAFYVLALFFSTLFSWQFVSSLGGLGDGDHGDGNGGDGGDVGHGDLVHGDVSHGDAHDGHLDHDTGGVATFRLLSIRSILAFGLLFSWAGALYLQSNVSETWALIRAVMWGLAGMIVVALFFWVLPRLAEEGTADLDTAVGRVGQVYLNIPEDGVGQIKDIVRSAVHFVRARSRGALPLPAGTMVRVVQRLDASTLEVEEIEA